MNKSTIGTGMTALIGMLCLTGTAQAADVDGQIKYRQNVMKALGGHVSAADRIMRGQVPMKDHLKLHATGAADIAAIVPSLFPKESVPPEAEFSGATVETDSTEAILEKPAEFEKAAKQTEEATAAFLKAVNEGADDKTLAKAFRAIGKSCKGCHEDFRKKKP